jgi:hypothetical protein
MDLLKTFYNDVHTREAVKLFMTEQLQNIAIERTMNREDVSGIADAMELINTSFDRLKDVYGIIETKDYVNEAR